MPIPKGLIVYKAFRHATPLPANIKYGYYSSKVISSFSPREKKTYKSVFHRYQKKKVKEIHFDYEEEHFTEMETRRIFSVYKNIQKCKIDSFFNWGPEELLRETMTKIIRRLFKVCKRLTDFEICQFVYLAENSKFFKSLLLACSLESLTLHLSDYLVYLNDFHLFIQTIKSASKRRLWPHFKSLNIDLLIKRTDKTSLTQSLQRVLKFLQDLKCCENIYRCSNFQLKLSSLTSLDSKQIRIFKEIAKVVPSLTKIEITDSKHSLEILEIFQCSKKSKEISISISDKFEPSLDLSPLNEISNLQELTLKISNKDDTSVLLCRDPLANLQTLVNLMSLSIEFERARDLRKEFKLDLSNLHGLKSLRLNLWFQEKATGSSNRIWLQEIFQEIGKTRKLERFSISFLEFRCLDFRLLLLKLGQSLQKLNHFSDFSLSIRRSQSIRAQDILACIKRLRNIQHLNLDIQGFYLKPKTFHLMIECIVNSFPILSTLKLMFPSLDIRLESCKILDRAISKMKSLNTFFLQGSTSDLAWEFIQNIIMKKVSFNMVLP